MKDKKMLSMIIISVIVVVVFIIIMIIISSVSGKRLSYEKVEDKMRNAAIKYYQEREEELPKENGNTVYVSASTLAESKHMKQLDKIVPEGSKCTGEVIVTKNGNDFLYSSILDCGADYKTKKLQEVLTDKSNIVISGDGLYAKESGYIYKGEDVNNLVQLGETTWAIMDIDSQGFMRLIKINGGSKVTKNWDNRYNIKEDNYNGINDYSVSRIKEFLVDLERDDSFIAEEYKAYVALKPWCIGKRSEKNLAINNEEECQEMSQPQMFGLPYVSDAFAASIDPNCKNIEDVSCDNYNYLSGYALSSWTMTGVKETTSSAYYIVSAAVIPTKTSSSKNIMPTIYLSNNVVYASGNGTVEYPYILK